MKLSQILLQLKTPFQVPTNPDQIQVDDIAVDSRLVKKNSVFFALPGKTKDGREFVADAVARGASLVISSEVCDHVFDLLVEFLKIFYSPLPANIYAITGTNGKTSTAEFTRQILQFLGKKSASVGTLGVMCDDEIKPQLQNSSLTTPDIVSLYKNLNILKKNAVDDVAIEMSSIGLEQGRVAGLKIDVAAFTNFTQDHLDYHKSMAEYFRCKMILFDSVLADRGCAVLNSDISEFAEIKKICENRGCRIIEYGYNARDLKLLRVFDHHVSFEFKAKTYEFDLLARGDFQAFNLLCALGNVLAKYELSEKNLSELLTKFYLLQSAPGRMQKVGSLANGAEIFVDFAHSPDALENVLKLARSTAKNRVIVLFGCGGDRDTKKRSVMGAIACKLADVVVVTDDNPRSENPAKIRAEIMSACDKEKTIEINDRRLAIEESVKLLQKDDVLILAGKGHEKYQIIGDKKSEFDEEKIVEAILK